MGTLGGVAGWGKSARPVATEGWEAARPPGYPLGFLGPIALRGKLVRPRRGERRDPVFEIEADRIVASISGRIIVRAGLGYVFDAGERRSGKGSGFEAGEICRIFGRAHPPAMVKGGGLGRAEEHVCAEWIIAALVLEEGKRCAHLPKVGEALHVPRFLPHALDIAGGEGGEEGNEEHNEEGFHNCKSLSSTFRFPITDKIPMSQFQTSAKRQESTGLPVEE